MKKFIKISLTFWIAIIGVIATSCSSKENELIGRWGNSFGLTNNYTGNRVYKETGATCFQTFTFEKGENGEPGVFTDAISPLVIGSQNPDDVLIGSKISGTWEVKGKKLYLYYDTESFSLTNADEMGRTDKMILEEEMAQKFLDDYKNLGAEGLSYEIVHKNNKTGLEIKFGNTKVTLIKQEDKN